MITVVVANSSSKSCRSTLTGMSPYRPELPSTDLFASQVVPVDDIHVLDGPATPVLVQRVLHLSAAVMTPGSAAHIAPISGPPGSHIGRQSSSTQHAMTASADRTQDSDRSGARRLADQ